MRTLEAEVSWRVEVAKRLERQQSARTTPAEGRMAEAGKSLGDAPVAVRLKPLPEVSGMSRAALARLLSDECRQLAKGAQENEPQHSDASSALTQSLPQKDQG